MERTKYAVAGRQGPSWAFSALLVLMTACIVGWDAARTSDDLVVRAKRFVVVDDKGVDVAELGYNDGAVRLRIPSKAGEPGIAIGSFRDGSRGMVLFDDEGIPVAEFSLRSARSSPSLWLGDRESNLQKRPKVIINGDKNGRPNIILLDKEMKQLWQAP